VFDLTLSFDNGPEPDVTPHVLDTLAKRGIKAAFFVIGEKLLDPERRRLATRAHDEGHWIGNHTFTHSVPLGLQRDPDTAEHEIARTQGLIGDLAHAKRWFRPFGGGGNLDARLLKPSVVEHLSAGGYGAACKFFRGTVQSGMDRPRAGQCRAQAGPDGPARLPLARCPRPGFSDHC
jgi:peptidoglycan/xylan/chitin deacetylase (PgdA/CDA1 family)